MTSEEVAQVLRKAGNPVRMVIARIITDNSGELPPKKPVVRLFSFIDGCFILNRRVHVRYRLYTLTYLK